MKFIIQRVSHAKCTVDNTITGEINKGFCVFIGISSKDTKEIADKMIKKLSEKRVISSLSDVLDKQVAKINELYSNKTLTGDQNELQLKLQELNDLIDRINNENNIVEEIKSSTEELNKDNLQDLN